MEELKLTVALTNVNMDNMSRKDMLEWVNNTVNGNFKKIEELCSGVAYCQMMEQLFPNCIGLKKIKTNAKLEYEQLHNLRLLQSAFTRLKYDKTVPIDRLLKGRFQDNFEFLQWFKKFYDSSCVSNGKENIPSQNLKSKMGVKSVSNPMLLGKDHKRPKELVTKDKNSQRCVSPASVNALQVDMEELKSKLDEITIEKNFYLNKLTAIETLLKGATERGEDEDFCKKGFKILYSTQSNSAEDSY